MTRRVHTFSYFVSPKDSTRSLRQFQTRDTAAMVEILRTLIAQGYTVGEAFSNPPPRAGVKKPVLLKVDHSAAREGDLLLQTTRPPMHDDRDGDRKRVHRGRTDLEQYVFDVVAGYLDRCSRSHVELAEACAESLEPRYRGLAGMRFYQCEGARFSQLLPRGAPEERPGPVSTTAAFLIRTEALWEGGPGLLCAFGMDGTSTLAWAYHLGHDWGHLVEEPGFTLALLTVGKAPARATTREWARDWKVEVALRVGPEVLSSPARFG